MSDHVLNGSVDDLGRPVVRIRLQGMEDARPAVVDTGCNVGLIVPADVARAAGLSIRRRSERTVLADGREGDFGEAIGFVEWLGEIKQTYILVIPITPRSRHPGPNDVPKISIGTELLRNSHLEIDFVNCRVRITR